MARNNAARESGKFRPVVERLCETSNHTLKRPHDALVIGENLWIK